MAASADGPALLPLLPQYRERVWGGGRLRPGGPPVGEAWVAMGDSVVAGGPAAGRTLGDLGTWSSGFLLGEAARLGPGFPLLIKLLDCHDWLSVQVHPDDVQAARLVGPGERGKTEAWYVLEAAPGAELLAGVRPGTTPQALAQAMRDGRVLEACLRHRPVAGEALFIAAGTLHALGPGLLLYEVQQPSDTTYRVYDWDRPASAGRALHLAEAGAVADPGRSAQLTPPTPAGASGVAAKVHCPYFTLDELTLDGSQGSALEADPAGLSPHVLTGVSGEVEVRCGDELQVLHPLETLVVAAGAGPYGLRAEGPARVLRAAVPGRADGGAEAQAKAQSGVGARADDS